MNLLGLSCCCGSSMNGSVAHKVLVEGSNCTLCSIRACSASSLKLMASRVSPFLHLLQLLHATHLYGDSVPNCSTCHSRLSRVATLYISCCPPLSSQWQWSQPFSSFWSSTMMLLITSATSWSLSTILLNLSWLMTTHFCSVYQARASAVRYTLGFMCWARLLAAVHAAWGPPRMAWHPLADFSRAL